MIELRKGMIACAVALMAGCGADSPEPMAPPAPAPEYYQPQPQPQLTPSPSPPTPSPGAWPLDVFIGTPEDAERAITDAELELAGVVDSGPTALGVSRCVRSCQALGSMRRAVARLCELTGDEDERCQNARVRLEASARKVKDAGCSC